MRRTGALAEDYARRHNVPRWYDDADKLIGDPEVDAVYVATTPATHLEYALKVAAAGKPCYVEKPMARSYAECRKMLDAFEEARQPLFVAYYRRAMPRFVKVKELIDSGRLGRITGCRYRTTRLYWPNPTPEWRIDAAQSGGGIILDIGSHVLDLMDHLFGEFVEYSGTASTTGATAVEDNVAISFRTARGVAGSASWNFAASKKEDWLEIDGTEARLSTEVITNTPLKLEIGDKTETIEVPDPPHVQQPLIQTVVDDLLGKGKCPSTGASGARCSRVMDAALNSFYGGRDDEFWSRPQTWGKS
jgi:predicted dehydrogenase